MYEDGLAMSRMNEMGNIPQLILANKLVTIVEELSKPEFLSDVGKFCGRYEILTGLSSWTTKNEGFRLLGLIADLFKRINLGGATITVALCQVGLYAYGNVSDLGSILRSMDFKNFKFPKAVCEVGEIGHFLTFVAENIPSYAKYAPGISFIAEGAEIAGTVTELLESSYRVYQFWNYQSNFDSLVNVSKNEKTKASVVLGINVRKTLKCTIKLFAIGLGVYGYSKLIVATFKVAYLTQGISISNAEKDIKENLNNTKELEIDSGPQAFHTSYVNAVTN